MTYRHGGHSRATPASTARTTRSRPGRRATRSRRMRGALDAAGVDAGDARRDRRGGGAQGRRRRGRGARRRSPSPDVLETQVWADGGRLAADADGGTDVPRRDRRRHRPGDGARPTVVLIGEDVGAAGGVFKLTEGLLDEFGPRARPRHADQRAGDRRRGDGRGDDRPAPDRRADVQRLLRGGLGHGRQPDREDPLHDRRPGVAAARAPDRQRRRAAVRRPAQPEHRELGDGDPGPEGRRAVDAGRHGGPDGGRDPRPRPGHRVRAQGAVRRRRARSPTASTSSRSARRASSARAPTCTIVALAAMVPRPLEAAERLAADHGISAEVIDLRTLVPLDARRSSPRSRRPAGCSRSRRTRGCAAGARRSCRSSPTRGSTASTRRSSGSRRRTSRCRRRRARGRAMPSVERIVETVRRRLDEARRDDHRRGRGHGRMGSAMARALARGGFRLVLYNRTPDGRRALAAELGRRVAATPAEAAARADVDAHDARRRRGGRDLFAGPTGCSPAPSPGRVLVDMSTVPPTTIRRSRPRVAAAARASSTRRSRAASRSPSGRADADGRRRRGGPRAGPAGPRPRSRSGSSTRAARHRRGDEARGQHRDLRAQRGAGGGARPRRAGRASIGRSPTTCSRPARSAPRSSATSGRRSSTRRRRRSRSRSTSPRRTCG